MKYKIFYRSWEQLSYSVCLGNKIVQKFSGSRINQITYNMQANITENITDDE